MKKLNVYFSMNNVDRLIVNFLKQRYEVNIINVDFEKIIKLKKFSSEEHDIIKSIDLIIFTGGEDVDPSTYGENIGKYTHINPKRDELEFNILNRLPLQLKIIINSKLKLGICRGAQLLTVYNGGSLIQHVENHKNNNQNIELLKSGKSIEISSDHHQMMYPFNLNKDSYELIGVSKHFQSNTYLNGDNNEINLPSDFLEPEIVYYNNKNSLCIQAHPEWCIGTEGSDFCLDLINKYLNKKEQFQKNFFEIEEETMLISQSEITNNAINKIKSRYKEIDDFLWQPTIQNK